MHGSDRRFDLVGPHRIILHHLPISVIHLLFFFSQFPLILPDDLPVQFLRQSVRIRERFYLASGILCQQFQCLTALPIADEANDQYCDTGKRGKLQCVNGDILWNIFQETQKPKNSDKKHHPEKDPRLFPQKCKDNSFFLILFSSLFLHRSSPFYDFLLSESSFQKSNTVKIS